MPYMVRRKKVIRSVASGLVATLNPVQLVFEAEAGSWAIDNVYIDPYRR